MGAMTPRPRVIVIEPEGARRARLIAHLGLARARVSMVACIAEAQSRLDAAEPAIVVARNEGGPEIAASLACAFDFEAFAHGLRIVVFNTPAAQDATHYLRAVDRTLAGLRLPTGAMPDPARERLALPEEFPRDFAALSRLGRLPCAEMFLVRSRVSARKELLLQVSDCEPGGGMVTEALYRLFRARRPPGAMLRHEATRHHSFLSSTWMPMELASSVEQAMRRPAAAAMPRAA